MEWVSVGIDVDDVVYACSTAGLLNLPALGPYRVALHDLGDGTIDLRFSPLSDAELSTPIEHFEFSVRTYRCLKREGVDTLDHLLHQSDEDLLDMRNFGRKSVVEVDEKLGERGLRRLRLT